MIYIDFSYTECSEMEYIPWASQIEMASAGFAILKEHGFVYFAGEERTGKLLASIVLAEMCPTIKTVLALTTKKALEGWEKTLANYSSIKEITATNYHQAKKLKPIYDLVILDECHNYIASYPKPSGMWKVVRRLTKGKPIIYTSATPHAQGRQMLYHQFALCDWSPWAEYSNYYQWWNEYGIANPVIVQGIEREQYNLVDDERIRAEVQKYFITKTRKELGFSQEPEDVLHYIELSEATQNTYNEILKDKVYTFLDGDKIVCDTPMKLKTTLHQIEGGGCKILRKETTRDGLPTLASRPKVLNNNEKINYILETWGDKDNVCIMYQYHSEGLKLNRQFKNALVLQGTTYAEGVDLSHIDHLVIYSQDFKVAKHSQRRARQANKKRKDKIHVHFLLVKGGISEQIYQTVSIKKQDFVDTVFEPMELNNESNARL